MTADQSDKEQRPEKFLLPSYIYELLNPNAIEWPASSKAFRECCKSHSRSTVEWSNLTENLSKTVLNDKKKTIKFTTILRVSLYFSSLYNKSGLKISKIFLRFIYCLRKFFRQGIGFDRMRIGRRSFANSGGPFFDRF